jgi:hypothetical protein
MLENGGGVISFRFDCTGASEREVQKGHEIAEEAGKVLIAAAEATRAGRLAAVTFFALQPACESGREYPAQSSASITRRRVILVRPYSVSALEAHLIRNRSRTHSADKGLN